MALRGYHKMVQDVTKCSDDDAYEIEAIMRTQHSTMDHLTARQFNKLARDSQKALVELRTTDPKWTSGPFYKG